MTDLTKSLIPFGEFGSTFIITGISCSGKTTFVLKMLQELEYLFYTTPTKVLFCYKSYQNAYDLMKEALGDKITFTQGVPSEQDIDEFVISNIAPTMLIFDDLSSEFLDNPLSESLISIRAHHDSIVVVQLTCNLYHKGKYARIVGLNNKIFVFMVNHRSFDQIRRFASQTGFGESLIKSYEDAITTNSHGYCLLDLSFECPPALRIRSNIFKSDGAMIVYTQKNSKTVQNFIPQ